jgi:uncharacterized membrane protein
LQRRVCKGNGIVLVMMLVGQRSATDRDRQNLSQFGHSRRHFWLLVLFCVGLVFLLACLVDLMMVMIEGKAIKVWVMGGQEGMDSKRAHEEI